MHVPVIERNDKIDQNRLQLYRQSYANGVVANFVLTYKNLAMLKPDRKLYLQPALIASYICAVYIQRKQKTKTFLIEIVSEFTGETNKTQTGMTDLKISIWDIQVST